MFIRGIKIGYGTNSSSYHNTIVIGDKERKQLEEGERSLYAVSFNGEVDFYIQKELSYLEKDYPKYGIEFFNKPDWREIERALILFDNYEDFLTLKQEHEYEYWNRYASHYDELTYTTEAGEEINIYCYYGEDR